MLHVVDHALVISILTLMFRGENIVSMTVEGGPPQDEGKKPSVWCEAGTFRTPLARIIGPHSINH
jgi:hypothetical protein